MLREDDADHRAAGGSHELLVRERARELLHADRAAVPEADLQRHLDARLAAGKKKKATEWSAARGRPLPRRACRT